MNSFPSRFLPHLEAPHSVWTLAISLMFFGTMAALLVAYLCHVVRYASLPVH